MSKYSHSFTSQIISLSTLIFLLRWKLVYVLQVPFSFSFTLSHYFFFHSLTSPILSLSLSLLGNSYSPTLMLFSFSILLSLCLRWFSLSLYIEFFFSLLLTVKNVTRDVPLPFFSLFHIYYYALFFNQIWYQHLMPFD